MSICLIDEHIYAHESIDTRKQQQIYASFMHTYTHEAVLPRTNHREHTPHSCTHTHTRQYCLVRITVSIRLIRAHTLPCSANYMMRNTQSNTCMHRLAINHSEHAHCTRPDTHSNTCIHRLAINHSEHAPCSCTDTHTYMHASPRSNHREHAPCSSANTQKHMHHCLAEITVSIHLAHALIHIHTCIASQQFP